jgi:hypothetical protein
MERSRLEINSASALSTEQAALRLLDRTREVRHLIEALVEFAHGGGTLNRVCTLAVIAERLASDADDAANTLQLALSQATRTEAPRQVATKVVRRRRASKNK